MYNDPIKIWEDEYPSHALDALKYTPRFFKSPKLRAPIWTTGQGEDIPIDEMEDSHVQNTISYLVKKKHEWEQAQEDAPFFIGERIINGLTVDQWLANFYAEIQRRQGE